MALIQLKSTNKKISWLINKNPDSLMVKKNRSGHVLGFFSGETFNILHKDVIGEYSYKAHENESQYGFNISSYNSSRFILDAIKICLNDALKPTDNDVPEFHNLVLHNINVNKKAFSLFERYFTDYFFISTDVSAHVKVISISNKTKKTLEEFLKFISLFGCVANYYSKDYIFIDEGYRNKFIQYAETLDVPYFIRYYLKIIFLNSEKKFADLKSKLESSKSLDIKLTFGNTHDARISFVKNNLNENDKNFLDVGVGEDYRYLRFLKGFNYVGIERDENALKSINKYLSHEKTSAKIFTSIDDYVKSDETKKNLTILCSEVLEHNLIEEAIEIINFIKKLDYKKIIFTVPNLNFNKNFKLEGFRHEDHKWEMAYDEFEKFMLGFFPNGKVFKIGDMVNGESVTTGFIVEK